MGKLTSAKWHKRTFTLPNAFDLRASKSDAGSHCERRDHIVGMQKLLGVHKVTLSD